MKYALEQTSIPASDFPTLGIMEIEENILQSWADLTTAEQNMKETQELMFNAQRSISLLKRFGDSMVPQLNIDKGLEELLGLEESTITAEKAIEGLVDSIKEGIKKFIEYVKELFTKIHIWVKNFINKIRTSDPLLSNPLSERLKKQGGHDAELKSATGGVVGPKFLSGLVQMTNKVKNCRSFVTRVIESKTIEDLEKIVGSIFFSSCAEANIVKGRLFDIEVPHKEGVYQYTTPHGYFTSSKSEYHPWMDEADSKAGITMSDLVAIERAQKDMFKTMIEFDGEVEVRLKSLVARLEKLDKADEEYKLLRTVVKVLASAVKSNNIFTGAINSSLDKIFKQIEAKMNGGTSSQTQSTAKTADLPKDFVEAVTNHDRTKIIAKIVFYLGELEEGTMTDMDLPLKAFNAASKEFKAANIELEQDDNGEWLQATGGIPEDPAQWNSDHFGKVKNVLRHRFCKRYLDLAMKVLKHLKNNKGGTSS